MQNLEQAVAGVKLAFPVTFDIKIIMEMKYGYDANKTALMEIFEELCVPFGEISEKYSSDRNFVSFSSNITLHSQEIYERLYIRLKDEKAVRFAL